MRFEMRSNGPFSLANANSHFGGWPVFTPDPSAVGMTFPVEGWNTSAAVIIRQGADETICGEVYTQSDDEKAWKQALATLSLDVDASGWAAIGQRDPVIGELQKRYQFIRPVLFHSPYEAAAAFIIGHRISIAQGRAIRQRMAQEIGDAVQVGDVQLHAFPRPQVLRELDSFKGVSAEKIERLHGVAQAALDGLLDRTYLLSLPTEEALEKLCTLKGVGHFFSQAILFRGAGVVDNVTDDETSKKVVQRAYLLADLPDQPTVQRLSEAWRPYRMWATVLLHVAYR